MKSLIALFSFILFISGCSAPSIAPIAANTAHPKVDYLRDVKPILDKRCVSCHSCYNAPCQAKFEAYEGVDRGGSKIEVYDALRLNAIAPTRLFVDAVSTKEWRSKGFYSTTRSGDSNATHQDSIMAHLLEHKQKNPAIQGIYSPETDALSCPKDKEELEEYLDAKPYHAMPYGFPALSKSEHETLMAWLAQGAHGPSKSEQEKLLTPSPNAANAIEKWERFLNAQDAKHIITARYLYEHLYLAHIYFESHKGKAPEFFELVRSSTPPKQPIKIIPTLRPFDDPKTQQFYYRFQKVHGTIVHKTHMPFKLDHERYERIHKLFIESVWDEEPHRVSYDVKVAANPFVAFRQIPPESRYRFLLENSHYIISTFIQGPVCRGQMALNVIHDHFWVMFKDPAFDVSVLYPEFVNSQAHNLTMPIFDVDKSLIKTFSDEYRKKYERYYRAKKEINSRKYPRGFDIDSIWRGERAQDAPLLSIYRHFDSASVHKGALGAMPRTLWVIDYAQFERIYYTLVAGYDVFGNLSHQTNIRRYMDFLRIEGEVNFLEYMPQELRHSMLKSWYINDNAIDKMKYIGIDSTPTRLTLDKAHPKESFLTQLIDGHFLKSTKIAFDTINYIAPDAALPKMPERFEKRSDYDEAARSLTLKGGGFISTMTDKGANNLFLRIDLKDGSHIVKNLIINRWHNNVNSIFNGEEVLDATKDTMDILDASIGSYPNAFCIVKEDDLAAFLHLLKSMKGTAQEYKMLHSFFISRSDPKFWEIYDWFVAYFYTIDPINAGLYDLNRYARIPWEKQ